MVISNLVSGCQLGNMLFVSRVHQISGYSSVSHIHGAILDAGKPVVTKTVLGQSRV